jgi:hypothetical protein
LPKKILENGKKKRRLAIPWAKFAPLICGHLIEGGRGGIQEGDNKNAWLAVAACHAAPKKRPGCGMLEGKKAVERFIRGKQGLVAS